MKSLEELHETIYKRYGCYCHVEMRGPTENFPVGVYLSEPPTPQHFFRFPSQKALEEWLEDRNKLIFRKF